MNPDVIDVVLIFAFVICVIAIAAVSALETAYRAGKEHGILSERERRRGVEQRVAGAIAETFKSAEWERELDV